MQCDLSIRIIKSAQPQSTGNKKRNSHLTVSLGSGSCLSSHAVASTVLSVYEGLTSVFGMRTGGTPQLNHRKGDWFS